MLRNGIYDAVVAGIADAGRSEQLTRSAVLLLVSSSLLLAAGGSLAGWSAFACVLAWAFPLALAADMTRSQLISTGRAVTALKLDLLWLGFSLIGCIFALAGGPTTGIIGGWALGALVTCCSPLRKRQKDSACSPGDRRAVLPLRLLLLAFAGSAPFAGAVLGFALVGFGEEPYALGLMATARLVGMPSLTLYSASRIAPLQSLAASPERRSFLRELSLASVPSMALVVPMVGLLAFADRLGSNSSAFALSRDYLLLIGGAQMLRVCSTVLVDGARLIGSTSDNLRLTLVGFVASALLPWAGASLLGIEGGVLGQGASAVALFAATSPVFWKASKLNNG